MTEEEQWYYNHLDDENKQNLDMVLNELKTYLKNNTLTILSELNFNDIENFLHDNDVNIYKEYKSELTTVFSVAKYIMLYATEKDMITKLNDYLEKNNSNKELDYTILKSFKNELFFKVPNKGELKVKYTYDTENERFNFYLIGHNNNFSITFADLKVLISGKSNLVITNKENNNLDNDLTITFNGMKIIIQKQ